MALTADQITAKNFKEFYDKIFPYLNGGLARNNYSTDEKIVGTWIDGKPLYQRTVDCGAMPNNTTKKVAHNIANLDCVVSITGITVNPTNHNRINLPFPSSTSNIGVDVVVDNTDIAIYCPSNKSAYTESHITLQYTKTTD